MDSVGSTTCNKQILGLKQSEQKEGFKITGFLHLLSFNLLEVIILILNFILFSFYVRRWKSLSKYGFKCSKKPNVDVTYLIEIRNRDYFFSAVIRKKKKK